MEHLGEVEADVECLMCARVIGQLFGQLWRTAHTARTLASLTIYRSNEPGAQQRAVRRREHFRCAACGGQGFVGEVALRAAPRSAAEPCLSSAPRTQDRAGPTPNGLALLAFEGSGLTHDGRHVVEKFGKEADYRDHQPQR